MRGDPRRVVRRRTYRNVRCGRWKPKLTGLQYQSGTLFSGSHGMKLSEQLSLQDLGSTRETLLEEAKASQTPQSRE